MRRTSNLISIVIPTYNCDRYIVQAVESAIAQAEVDVEIIVIDDGSTDRTCDRLLPYFDRVRYVRQTNAGVAVARNRGIDIANGKFIAFLDADDWFLPGKLAAQLAVFAAQPHLGIVHSGWQRVSANGDPLISVRPWKTVPVLDLEAWLRWKPILPSAMMFRTEWLRRSGGFDPRYPPAEDTELTLRLALMGCEAAWLPQVTVCYRQHEGSAMHKGLPQARSLAAAIDDFFARPELPPRMRAIEHQIRYGTLVWIAWYLFRSGHTPEMATYLRQARQFSFLPAIDMLVNWGDLFAEYSKSWGEPFDCDRWTQLPEWRALIAEMFHLSLRAPLIIGGEGGETPSGGSAPNPFLRKS